MDHPSSGPSVPIQLRRTCECNRLERQFLIHAYECLVTLVTPAEPDHATDDEVPPEEESSDEHAPAREARGIGCG